ncbi:hypothetical protein, partial [Sulfurimonas sp.]|uniref:hypothetical protein n=1 Tax=Sulfurimonas sp. TaxID=2022749 RepID=UPI0025EF6D7C
MLHTKTNASVLVAGTDVPTTLLPWSMPLVSIPKSYEKLCFSRIRQFVLKRKKRVLFLRQSN